MKDKYEYKFLQKMQIKRFILLRFLFHNITLIFTYIRKEREIREHIITSLKSWDRKAKNVKNNES